MMRIAQRVLAMMNGLAKSYGPSNIKKFLWDKEYTGGKWHFADDTVGDCVYPHLEKHVKNGSLLDLGCGSGNTANELAATAYRTYVGVDISEVCLSQARSRTEKTGRTGKNRFERWDFISYVPTQKFDVILFRESIYHIPMGQIKTTLERYSPYLERDGVFIVRLKTADEHVGKSKARPKAMVGIIEAEFDVVERDEQAGSGAAVIVFRPNGR
jgi:2-polyprenyl-3-methyl-5-hydroxy-6-metoxy-1,4-benzoquinol methylase